MKRSLIGVLALTTACMFALLLTSHDRAIPHAVEPPDPPRFVHVVDGKLELDGKRYRFLGANVYSLLSADNDASGFVCGLAHDRLSRKTILRELASMHMNVVRLSAYQPFTASGKDFVRLDETIELARRYGIRLVLILEGQWGHCSTLQYMTPAWYRGGYREPYGDYAISYLEYVQRIVTRYKDEETILAWQLMNEAEASEGMPVMGTPDPDALTTFARDMSEVIRAIDGNHLVSLGTISDTRAGLDTVTYANVLQLPGVDLAEGHDYDLTEAFPYTMRRCQKIAELTKRPFMIGEVGVSTEEHEPAERATLLMEKIRAAWNADVDGVLMWSYKAGDGRGFDIVDDDPIIPMLRQFGEEHLADRADRP